MDVTIPLTKKDTLFLIMIKKIEPLFKLNNAGVHQAGRWLVRGVSFSLEPGEIVTLIGPNGSGKSTTAKMALGIIKPNEGQVTRSLDLRSLTYHRSSPLTGRFLLPSVVL